MNSLEKPKTPRKSKAKTTKTIKQTQNVKQVVKVNVEQPKKTRKPRAKKQVIKQTIGRVANIIPQVYDAVPTYREEKQTNNLAKRTVLTNNPINEKVANKNITPLAENYLEGKEQLHDNKSKSNSLNAEVEAQQEAFEYKKTAKGKGLAENVLTTEKPKYTYNEQNPFSPNSENEMKAFNQFVETKAGNTDKIISFDTEAEGTEEKNFQRQTVEGIEKPIIKIKPGRPAKYTTEEERAEAKRQQQRAYREKQREDAQAFRNMPRVQANPLTEGDYHQNQEIERRSIFLENEPNLKNKFTERDLSDEVAYMNNTNNSNTRIPLNENIDDYPTDTNQELTRIEFQ